MLRLNARGAFIGTFATLAGTLGANRNVRAQSATSVAPYISPAFPSDLVSAKRADRIAWLSYERGQRNAYAAAAPDFKPVRLTNFTNDDGVVLTDLSISDDGSTIVFVRGSEPNREGWIANPSSDAAGAERTIWAARTSGGAAWKLGEGSAPALSPDGHSVAFVKSGQIFRFRVSQTPPTSAIDKAEQPIIKAWGRNTSPRWSPDGSKLAFISVRDNHSFVAIYDVKSRQIDYVAPSVDFDVSPTWSPDSKRIAFIRRPGTPFGQQAQAGDGSIGNPGGAAGARGGRGGRGGRGAPATDAPADGLYRALFRGGYSLSLMVADVAAPDSAREFWHNQPNDRAFANINNITWAGESVIFSQEPEEWIRIYAVKVAGGASTPIELTPGTGAVESLGLSNDGQTLFYATNAGDIDRRHIWKVPTSGGTASQITTGAEIEMYPAALASGKGIAVLTSAATRPMSVGIVPATGGAARMIFPVLSKDYLAITQVAPQNVTLKADDGIEFHNQIFLPKDLKPNERRPAIVFVHGGPIRQMLLGYHYMDFYHTAYAVNEWLASRGYIVMSVNYRSGIGYGKSFRTAANVGARGNAEYRDVIAAGKYLQTRGDVDPARVGIWGLSYGGILTAEALARNSDVFVAGVDMAGVHLWGSSLDSTEVSYKSSAISAIDSWRSPVLIWHNDDDRNVEFSQTIGLVDLLRARNVYYELIVNPDDTHETLVHKRWLYLFGRMDTFLQRFLWNKNVSSR
jgi:dipeptidyl-peptidase-4